MNKDFFAEYPVSSLADLQKLAKAPPGNDARTFIALLAQTTALEDTKPAGVEMHASAISGREYQAGLEREYALLESLELCAPERPSWDDLPKFSCFLRMDFQLETPYLSRDDRAFSITENPIRKEHVFGVPYISSTSWKGALRHACQLGQKGTEREVSRLFGPAHKNEDGVDSFDAFRGRVRTYPSFFKRIGAEMINPHDRRTRTGKNPIRMECVPAAAESRLALLYVPLCEAPSAKPTIGGAASEVAIDLPILAQACADMMLRFGFSAKKTSGYGSAAKQLTGTGGLIEAKLGAVISRKFTLINELPVNARVLAEALSGTE